MCLHQWIHTYQGLAYLCFPSTCQSCLVLVFDQVVYIWKTLCTSDTSTRCCSGCWCVRVPRSFLYKIIYNQHFSLTQAVFKFQSVSLLTSKRPKQLSWETQCDISQKNQKKTITSTVQWILVLLYVNCNHIGACDFKSGLSMFEI